METGTCAMDWSGLQSLLQNNMVLRFRSKTCPNANMLASVTVDCIGTDCAGFQGIHPCSVVRFSYYVRPRIYVFI